MMQGNQKANRWKNLQTLVGIGEKKQKALLKLLAERDALRKT